MKKIALALTVSAALAAPMSLHAQDAESFYVGGNLAHYLLDQERFIHDDDESTVLSGVVGYRTNSPIAFELGYGESVGGEDVEAMTFNTYYYMKRSESGWAPFLMGSFSSIDFDDASNLVGGDDSSQQLGIGLGLSKMLTSQLEVKGNTQLLFLGGEDSSTDLAFNLGMNYYFNGPAAAPAPVVQAAAPAPAPAPAAAPQTRTITVKLNVEFEFDKDVVRAIYGDELNAVANAMKAHNDIQLVLEGHTDAKGTDAYNQNLSQRRVDAVKARLVQQYGIPAGRISTVGYGESRPIADNATDEGRARNRRVVGELSFSEVVAD